jgi:hypothetical protein
MTQHLAPSFRRSALARSRLAAMPLCAALAACSADVVNMGEDEERTFVPPPHSRCVDNPTLSGDVVIRNQAELDALEGCSTIDGHLLIQGVFEPDLRPLHELRVVRGELGFGGSYFYPIELSGPSGVGLMPEEAELYDELVSRGLFLPSLEGLERLEAVGSLYLGSVAASSLEPLAGLRQLTEYGALTISECNALVDLLPLSELAGIQSLELSADNLESLDGLQLRERITRLSIAGKKLTNIDALSKVRSVHDIVVLYETALRDLSGLASLREVGGLQASDGGLYLADNPSLESLRGLEGLGYLKGLSVTNNDALEDLAPLAFTQIHGHLRVRGNENLRQLTDLERLSTSSFEIVDNARLEALPPMQSPTTESAGITLSSNPALQRFTVPTWIFDAALVSIENNAALRELDLSDLKNLDRLEIENNPALGAVRLDALDTVDTLEVVNNPLLPLTSFDPVRTFERTMTGNAGDAP